MPGLSNLHCHGNRSAVLHLHVIPAEGNVGLAETELGGTVDLRGRCGSESRIEVGLDLGSELCAAELVSGHVKSEPGGQ